MQDGSDRLLYIYDDVGLDWIPIGCLTENSFTEATEMLDATMRSDADGWTQAIPSHQTYNISFSGVLSLDDRGGTIMTYNDIQTLKRARTKIQWRITSDAGEAESGYGYIVNLSNSASVEEFVTFDGAIVGVGNPSSVAWSPPATPELDSMIPPYNIGKS